MTMQIIAHSPDGRTGRPGGSPSRLSPDTMEGVSTAHTRDRVLAAGQRLTPQRDLIAGVLEEARQPVTAQEVWHRVTGLAPGIGRATVFRTLDALVGAGIARRIVVAPRRTAYVPCSDHHHHHLVCQRCGTVQELPEADVAPLIGRLLRARGFVVDHASLDVLGTCAPCAAAPASAQSPSQPSSASTDRAPGPVSPSAAAPAPRSRANS